jgi:hypothetical protein
VHVQRLVVPAPRGLAQPLEQVAGVPVREQEGCVVTVLLGIAGAALAVILARNFFVLWDYFMGGGRR